MTADLDLSGPDGVADGTVDCDPPTCERCSCETTLDNGIDAEHYRRHAEQVCERCALNAELAETLESVRHWASRRCPCGPPDYAIDEPKICPLCQADVVNGYCKAVETIFPRDLLTKVNRAIAKAGRHDRG